MASSIDIDPIRHTLPPSIRAEVLQVELDAMAAELPDLSMYRRYYDGEQDSLVFGTDKFQEYFDADFPNFRDNWTEVVVDSRVDKMSLVGLRVGKGRALVLGEGDENEEDGPSNTSDSSDASSDPGSRLATQIWQILQSNNFDEQSGELVEGMLVEGKSYIIVWPDPEITARVDWKPAQQVRVRYSDYDDRVIVFGVRRWQTPSGETWVTVYTRDFVYKYKEVPKEEPNPNAGRPGAVADSIPDSLPNAMALEVRQVVGDDGEPEPWPLPNPLGVVTIVEVPNRRYKSEIAEVIPKQDAINYTLMQSMVAGEYSAMPQRVMLTDQNAPAEGWINKPGVVWKLGFNIDADGKKHPSAIAEFSPASLDQWVNFIGMFLQHVALTSKTPVRYFFKSDRGGRGDAPSGESLKVEDGPLLDLVRAMQRRVGNRLYTMANLIYRCIQWEAGVATEDMENLPPGEFLWRSLDSDYQSALLEDAKVMAEVGIPLKFIAKKIGLPPEEVEELLEMLEEQEQENERLRQEEMEAAREAATQAAAANGGGNGAGGSRPAPTSPAQSSTQSSS